MTQRSPSYTQASPGAYQSYQNYNQMKTDDHQKTINSNISPGNCHPSQKTSGMYSQNSPKSYSSNPSPQSYQEINCGQNRNAIGSYENRTLGNGNMYQNERYVDHQSYPAPSPNSQNYGQNSPTANQDKSNVNARIKSMIMNKHQMSLNQHQNIPNNNFSVSENHLMSPNREMMSPGQHNVQLMSIQNSQMMSPHLNANQVMSPTQHNNQMSSPHNKEGNSCTDKMQHNDYGGEKKQGEMNDSTNHFLAFSHHLREGSILQPEGGGIRHWTGVPVPGSNNRINSKPNFYETAGLVSKSKKSKKKCENIPSAMENFVKFASTDFQTRKMYPAFQTNSDLKGIFYNANFSDNFNRFSHKGDPIRNLEVNFPTKRNSVTPNPTFNNFKMEEVHCYKSCSESFPSFQNLSSTYTCNNNNIDNWFPCGSVKQEEPWKNEKALNGYEIQTVPTSSNYMYNCNDSAKSSCVNSETVNTQTNYGSTEIQKHFIKTEFPAENADCLRMNNQDMKLEENSFKPDCSSSKTCFITSPTTKVEYPKPQIEEESSADVSNEDNVSENSYDSFYQKISYAPNFKNMKVIDKRFIDTDIEGKSKWEEYKKSMNENKCDEETVKNEIYLFQGEGGPTALKKPSGAWCCRMGGTEPPTAEHLKEGDCQVFCLLKGYAHIRVLR